MPVDQVWLTKCRDVLPKLSEPTLGAALSNHVKTTALYYECARRHAALVDAVGRHNDAAKKSELNTVD